jgi:hypothetical protein
MMNSLMKAIASTLLLWSPMLVAVSTLAYPETTQSSTDKEFVGTINHTLSVRIKLSQAGTVLSGSYAYEKIGKSLRLKGAMDGDVEFHLEEFDDAGNKTGKFEGKFVTPDWIEGSWSSTRGKKEIPFSAFVIDGKQVPAASPDDKISGQYKRVIEGRFDKNSVTLNVWLLKQGSVRIQGDATWIGNVKTGNVNLGEVDDIFASEGDKFSNNRTGGDSCSFTVAFGAGSVTVSDGFMNCGGINVTFDGKYRKIGPPKP